MMDTRHAVWAWYSQQALQRRPATYRACAKALKKAHSVIFDHVERLCGLGVMRKRDNGPDGASVEVVIPFIVRVQALKP